MQSIAAIACPVTAFIVDHWPFSRLPSPDDLMSDDLMPDDAMSDDPMSDDDGRPPAAMTVPRPLSDTTGSVGSKTPRIANVLWREIGAMSSPQTRQLLRQLSQSVRDQIDPLLQSIRVDSETGLHQVSAASFRFHIRRLSFAGHLREDCPVLPPRLTELNMRNCMALTAADFTRMHALTRLVTLSIGVFPGSHGAVALLRQCPQLRSLTIGFPLRAGKHLTAAFIQHPGITHLSTDYIDPGFAASLCRNHRLRHITLQGVLDDSARSIFAHPHVTHIDLSNSALGTGSMQALRGNTALRTLHLENVHAVPPNQYLVAVIAHKTAVRTLALPRMGLTNIVVSALFNNNAITSLDLSENDINDAALPALLVSAHLLTLSLRKTAITAEGLLTLADSRHLTHLDVRDCPLGDQGWPALMSLAANPHLRSLSVSAFFPANARLALQTVWDQYHALPRALTIASPGATR